jgi:hypothetical protein
MDDYRLHTLTPEGFEALTVRVCMRMLGIGTIGFSKGPDGGRDAKFSGTADRFPSESNPWTGRFVIQAKNTSSGLEIRSVSNRNGSIPSLITSFVEP